MSKASQRVAKPQRGRSTGAILLEFLGSMNLAITLLVAVSVASVIGTVLQQNQPFGDYLIKFGPFWFDVFRSLGLYDLYSASWFLFILAFLVVSTSICLTRHTPMMWKEMTRYRAHAREASLRALSHKREWSPVAMVGAEQRLAQGLKAHGFRWRRKQHEDGSVVLGAMKGRYNRLGYIFTHLAVVVIGVGGLIDGNLPLKWREFTGAVTVETRNIPLSQIPRESWLPLSNPAFRGSVTIPEGRAAGIVFLPLGEGYVVQELPFVVEVEEFRIEHWPNGQPRSFESDLVINDPDLDEPLRQTIAVNHPLFHKGYAIYQASFSDGGSKLQLKAWPLSGDSREPKPLDAEVFKDQPLSAAGRELTLEMSDFQVFNVRPDAREGENVRKFKNVGPSFIYRLRRPTGEALEYENFMQPIQRDERWYYLSGVRRTVAEEFHYLYIPADAELGLDRFMNVLSALQDPQLMQQLTTAVAADVAASMGAGGERLTPDLARTAQDLVEQLLEGGFPQVFRHIEERFEARGVEAERREVMTAFSRTLLERTLERVFEHVLAAEGVEGDALWSDDNQAFYLDALNAITALSDYGAPVYLQLTGFEHIQSTGLQITRAPGQNVVYFGFVLLVAGIFLLFYVPQRRVWVLLREERDGEARVLLAGMGRRDPLGFEKDFAALAADMERRVSADSSSSKGDTDGHR